MRRSIVLVVVLSFLWLGALPAHAAVSVTIIEPGFSPATITVPQGEDVSWSNDGTRQHTSTQDAPLALWNTGRIDVGDTSASITFFAAGAYPYHCSIHQNMLGLVRVPILASPARGTRMTRFTLRLASARQAAFTYDVQRRKGTGAFTIWKTGVSAIALRFHLGKGTFAFRSRLHRTSTDATSGWSLPRTITVR